MYRGSWFRYYALCLQLCKVKTEHFISRTSTMSCNGAQCWVKWRTSRRIWQRCPVNTGSIVNHLGTVYYWREFLLRYNILTWGPGPERSWTSCFNSSSPNADPDINSHKVLLPQCIVATKRYCNGGFSHELFSFSSIIGVWSPNWGRPMKFFAFM